MQSTTIGSKPTSGSDRLGFLNFNPQLKQETKFFLEDYIELQHFTKDPKFDNHYATKHINKVTEGAERDIDLFIGNIKSTIEANKNLPPSEAAKSALENLRNRFLPQADFQKMLTSKVATLTEEINGYVAQIHMQYKGASSNVIKSIRSLIDFKKGLLTEYLKKVR